MELKITKLRIKNFRNINELEINFNNNVNEIKAENGKGKTNILSAIMWCLFGKNIYDDKKFVISPIIDNEERNDITTEVTLVINDNYVVTRLWYQRKATLMTGYVIEGKEEKNVITQNKFADELKEKFGIDEETFKSLSNINYLPNLNWRDLKEFIFSLIGDITDEEVLLRGDFSLVEEQIKLMGINATKDSLLASDKAVNDEIKRLETEYQTTLNIKEEFVASSEELEKLKSRKEEIERELTSYKEKQKELQENRELHSNKQKEIDSVEQEIQSKSNTIQFNKNAIEDYKKSYELNSTSVDIIREKEMNYIQNKIDSVSNRLVELDKQTTKYEEELNATKAKGKEIQEKKIKVENDTCSACGQKLPEEKINETLENLKQQQLEELQKLQNQVNNLTNIIGSNSIEYEQKIIELDDLKKELEQVKIKEYQAEEENEKQKQIRVARENKELENKTLENEIPILKEKLDKLLKEKSQLPTLDLEISTNSDLFKELDEINDKLATTITLEKIEEKLALIEQNLTDAKNNKNKIKEKMNQVIQFNNLKAELVREKAKRNFNIVDFKTKEYTQDGVEQETFKICIDGIDYKELNTGMKILVAIDLLTGIQKLKDVYVPIIIDNAENLTSDIQVDNTQLIIARAIKGINNIEVS